MRRAFPQYAKGCGLLTDTYALTLLGQPCARDSSLLTRVSTQWLMHYHLSAPNGPGPQFWSDVVYRFFRPGTRFHRYDIRQAIEESALRSTGKTIRADSTATAFLGTYTKDEGLRRLGIVQTLAKDEYEVAQPQPPDPWVLAYAFVSYWGSVYGDRRSINLDDLTAEGGFSDLFLLSSAAVETMLRTLQQNGYIELHRVAQPYQIVLLHNDVNPILAALYGPPESL